MRDLGEDVADEAIIDTMLGLGQTLNLDVVAEGIERTEQLDALARLGCSNYQGFYFYGPMPKSKLMDTFSSTEGRRLLTTRFASAPDTKGSRRA